MKALNEMTGGELVGHYNLLAMSDLGKELGAKPTQKFKDLATGIKRIEALTSSIKAREEGLKAEAKQPAKGELGDAMATLAIDPTIPQEETTAMAKTAKKTKKTAAPKAAKANGTRGIHYEKPSNLFEQFQARPGTNLEKVIKYLTNEVGKRVTLAQMASRLYDDKEATGPVGNVLKGVVKRLADLKLPYVLDRDDEGAYALVKSK